ncbi:149_t:CDS:2 [Diversispora eburnea]|uniref:149_t:CDS:1 n=1 Tax=Diversispora eburnea TaxID=1213867 RepID=A0A9N9FUC5_9GLOM|nr:149_t:CDS:2 [Diversispora eburnea]
MLSNQTDSITDSLLPEPQLYVCELHFGIGDDELIKLLKDVDPLRVDIRRQHGSTNNNGVIHFPAIENAEKAFAIYNNIKLDAYKTYLKLQITDPMGHGIEPQANAYILQVRQLPLNTTNLSLYDLFRPFGPLFSARMQYQDNKFKGHAFVQYFKQEHADLAIRNMNCFTIDNKTILTAPPSPGPEGPIVDPCNLFIKNLDSNISSSDLFNHFRRFGRIISARVMRDQETGNSKGFGFVSYTNSEEADRAKSSMHGKTLGTKQIVVRLHEPKKLREAKLANQFSSTPASPSESRAPSRRNSDLYIINTVNEFGRDDLSGLAPKARKEVLMSELQKRFKYIPSVPHEEVNPIIEHLLSMKTDDVLHILKDATALQQKITEARHHLQQEKKRRGAEEAIVASINTATAANTSFQQLPQREKFLKVINKLCPRYSDEILDLIMSLSQKERTLCYFNSDYLTKKILEANQALEAVNDEDPSLSVTSREIVPIPIQENNSIHPHVIHNPVKSPEVPPVVSNNVHDFAAYEEIEKFIESVKNKPIHEQKQKLGDRLFPKVKSLGLKSAQASKVTINLLDTDDLRELAHSMNDLEKFRQKVNAAAEKVVTSK